jgi:TonB-dependent receptor
MRQKLSKITLAVLSATSLNFATSVYAQEVPAESEVEVIQVTGMRASLTNALAEKRDTDNLVEIINAIDIGKLPDQNLAEVLENVTGVQITRTAGVGTGVQIRGSNANRVEINGASTVGSGTGRSGMNFEDISAAIIAGVEVTKASEAKTTEGSVGGTINIRTIRPLELTETLGSLRAQGEDSSRTTDGVQPRMSGAYGDSWELDSGGKFGVVISGSYSKQEATSFRPRLDRDGSLVENVNANVVRSGELEDQSTERPAAQEFDFLGIQFVNQELENFEYETKNIAASFEYAPNDNLKFFFDAVVTKQERRQDSSRVQGSGIAEAHDYWVPDVFETVDFGSLDGNEVGSIQAALIGTVGVNLEADDDDPNLRFSSDTGARITDTEVFRLGGEWQGDNLKVSVEISSANSDTISPKLDAQVNFVNPNAPLDALDADGNPTAATSNDNSVPLTYDLSGGSLTFGVAFDAPYAPTAADLLDPNNVMFDQVDISRSTVENSEDVFRTDFTYFLDDNIIGSIDFGYRYNKTKHTSISSSDRIGNFSKLIDSPNGSLFSELLVPGPSNFDDADGRELAFRNFLVIDPDRAFNDQAGTLAILEAALATHRAQQEALGFTFDSPVPTADLTPSLASSFAIEEETHALYAQANFEYEMIRGNFGVRYLTTDIASIGNNEVGGVVTEVVTPGDYSYTLPRLNVVADVTDDIVVRFSWGQDIRRPDFDIISTSVQYTTSENASVSLGNPGLEPEEVTSLDLSAEWYFAEAAVVSIGYFNKKRSNLFVTTLNSASIDANGKRDGNSSCVGGGIWNPATQPNSFGVQGTT